MSGEKRSFNHHFSCRGQLSFSKFKSNEKKTKQCEVIQNLHKASGYKNENKLLMRQIKQLAMKDACYTMQQTMVDSFYLGLCSVRMLVYSRCWQHLIVCV